MTNISYYINGAAAISPQVTFDNPIRIQELKEYDHNVLKCVTPDFKTLINPVQLRRLSRFLRIGLSAANICLKDANEKSADGIITATGYGFLDDKAKFLTELLQQHELQVAPMNFTQSTYNALAGLVALHVKCQGYNSTYVGKGHAFETAMLDAMMQLEELNSTQLLVGCFDEADETHLKISGREGGYYKIDHVSNLKLFESHSRGFLQGEGAAFFMISSRANENTWCKVKDLKMMNEPTFDELKNEISIFLEKNGMTITRIDLLMKGASGDYAHDQKINQLAKELFPQHAQMNFKHLSGEYCTASSFGLWIGASTLKHQQVPFPTEVRENQITTPIKTVLIINQYMDKNYSFILLLSNDNA